jgi:uncharacterized protein (TIGR02246 family)
MTDRDADVRAIEQIVAVQQDAFNTKDADLFASPWRERSWAVSVTGVEIEGREAMRVAAERGFAGPLADQFAVYRPGTVELLGDDVAILHVYAQATDPDGTPVDVGHAMIALYVFERGQDGWQIVARQNTLVTS